MARIARKNHETQYFHVIVQGINKEWIFKKQEYLDYYKKLLLKNEERYNVKILAYCIMHNHAHILLYCNQIEEMSKYMKSTNTSYANYYNKVEQRVGVVFRNRYESEAIKSKQYLLNCIAYIHNNPVKAKIVKQVEEYKYSSYNDYIKQKGIATKQAIELIFGSNRQYIEQYRMIHKNTFEFKDLIRDKKEIEKIIEEYENANKISIRQIKEDKRHLRNLLASLVNEGHSVSKISEKLRINRFKLSRIIKG